MLDGGVVKSSQIIDELCAAQKAGDMVAVRGHAHGLLQQIRRSGAQLEPDDWRRLLKTLKNGRLFDELRCLAEVLLQAGHDEIGIRCFYAQGLIEAGRMEAALSVLARPVATALATVKDKCQIEDPDILEALGLAGRARKQIYIDFAKQAQIDGVPLAEPARAALRKSIMAYGGVLASGCQTGDGWHEINYVATAKLAERLGIIAPQSSGADQIAAALIKRLGAQAECGADPWCAATVGEAYLAFGQWQNAAKFYGLFAAHKDIEAFQLASAIRQLEEIWQLDTMRGAPRRILQALKAELMNMPGSELILPSGAIQSLGDDLGPAFEAVFGKTEPLKVAWFEKGLRRAKSVARIKINGRPHGTGFLVPGRALSPHLQDKPYLLTNAHVLSDPPAHYIARPPHAARVFFEESAETDRVSGYRCSVVWQSGIESLDAALLELEADMPDLEAFPLAGDDLYCDPAASKLGNGERVNVIGHPGSEKLSISIQDNQILDVGPRFADGDAAYIFYHYKTPTKPGNSGSPVCHGEDWTVYALHHAGPQPHRDAAGVLENTMARLRGQDGYYEANEGVSIVSIRRQIQIDLDASWSGSDQPDAMHTPVVAAAE